MKVRLRLTLLTLMVVGLFQALFWQGLIMIYLVNGQSVRIYEDFLPMAIFDIIVLILLIFSVIFIAMDYMIMLADKNIKEQVR